MTDLPTLGRRLAQDPPLPPTPRGRLEDRWRRRRRVAAAGVVVAVAALIGTLAGVMASVGGGGTKIQVIGPPVLGSGVQPVRPTALVVGLDGGLYVSDPALNEILERLHDGRFVVVAGTGSAGFSGDGGPATRAALNDPTGMALAPDGTLYFADSGNRRVRAIGVDGVIRTVAGGGSSGRSGYVRGATPALSAAISPSDVTFGPGGRLYIATGEQVLRLETDGTLTPVAGAPPSLSAGLYGLGGPALDGSADGANGIAFDSAGDLYIAGSNTKSLLVVRPDGILSLVGSLYPRGNGGLVTSPNGDVLAMDELSVDAVTPSGPQRIVSFDRGVFQGIRAFSPNGIAVGADGTIYADSFKGNGYAEHSAIAAISPTGSSASLLWEEGSITSSGSPPAPGVLHGDGIGSIAFGQAQASVTAALQRLLGPAGAAAPGGPPSCGVDTTLHWADLDAYFFKGRFVGYSTQSPRLATEAGLRVGDALSLAQQLYRSTVVTSIEQGGAWFVATPSGEIEGFLSSEPNRTPAPQIATIEAGSAGCPAETP